MKSKESKPITVNTSGRLLTVQEAAEMLGLSKFTVRQWIFQRRLPVIRLGRAVRLASEDLEEMIARCRCEASTVGDLGHGA